MNIAIIGAGLIGRKRAQALPKNVKLSIVCDSDQKKAKELAFEFKCKSETNWKKVVKTQDIQAVIISTFNKYLSEVAVSAILHGKHVLIEKPGARNLTELKNILNAYNQKKGVVMFGYNHRYHPAIMKAKHIVDSNKYGNLLFIRARYGHGGRLGYEKEWRFDKNIAGGGELMDQGSHLIDLVNYFCGQASENSGYITNLFWKTKLEDAAFFQLRNKQNQIAHLSVTCVEWKNIFSFEIMLQKAKIQVEGLGRSYGKEELLLYTMKPQMGPPNVKRFEFGQEDNSWKEENKVFFKKIQQKDYSNTNIKDALYVMTEIEKLYQRNRV